MLLAGKVRGLGAGEPVKLLVGLRLWTERPCRRPEPVPDVHCGEVRLVRRAAGTVAALPCAQNAGKLHCLGLCVELQGNPLQQTAATARATATTTGDFAGV